MKNACNNLEPSAWVLEQSMTWPDNGQVLDFACGYGRHSIALAERFEVFAVDHNAKALSELAKHPKITTCACDLESSVPWPFSSAAFDAVVITNYLFRPKLDALFDLVADGGYLAYETFAVGNAAFGRPKNPDFLLHDGELAARLSAHFEILYEFCGMVNTPAPAVIQRVAAHRR